VQAAPLAFMFKDRFMKNIGFQRVVGDTWFKQDYAGNRWGVDDRTFFQQSRQLIEALREQPGPWFATMLTVGTHHPYVVPRQSQFVKGDDKFANATEWLDVAIGEFLDCRGPLTVWVPIVWYSHRQGID
jgi:phosphoglycerol transferase MdoB-like AlkP superfamily enzyme